MPQVIFAQRTLNVHQLDTIEKQIRYGNIRATTHGITHKQVEMVIPSKNMDERIKRIIL